MALLEHVAPGREAAGVALAPEVEVFRREEVRLQIRPDALLLGMQALAHLAHVLVVDLVGVLEPRRHVVRGHGRDRLAVPGRRGVGPVDAVHPVLVLAQCGFLARLVLREELDELFGP